MDNFANLFQNRTQGYYTEIEKEISGRLHGTDKSERDAQFKFKFEFESGL